MKYSFLLILTSILLLISVFLLFFMIIKHEPKNKTNKDYIIIQKGNCEFCLERSEK